MLCRIRSYSGTTLVADNLQMTTDPAASQYVTYIDGTNGVRVYAASGAPNNYTQVNSSGMQVFTGGTEAASFSGSTVKLGETSTTAEIQLCNNKGYIYGTNYNNTWAGVGKYLTLGTNESSSSARGTFITTRAKSENSYND